MVPPLRPAAVIGWTALGSLVPGLGLLRAGRRRLGGALLALALASVAGIAVLALGGSGARLARSLAVDPDGLLWAAGFAGFLAVDWALLVVVTHVALRRRGARLGRGAQVASAATVLVLVAAVAAPAVLVADYALLTRQTLLSVFDQPVGSLAGAPAGPAPRVEMADPWDGVPRTTVLLIGSDSGPGRIGVRPDTLVVATTDTRTGDTLLLSLPRNLQRVPFPEGSPAADLYPRGFYCVNPAYGVNTDCLLNGIWTFGEDHPDLYPDSERPGLTATVQAAEGVTGLPIDHYVMVNLRGFRSLVDAIGGITVDVRERLPIGGDAENPRPTNGWIEPGRQRLDGYRALWFARSRWSTNDYDRMRRQRCVLGALSEQADPLTLARNLPEVMAAARENVQTDIPLAQLDAWMELAGRIRSGQVRSLPFTDDVISTSRPDFARVHALVEDALDPPPAADPDPSPSPSASPSPGTSPSPSSSPSSSPSPSASSSPSETPSRTPSPAGNTLAEDVRETC